MPLALACTGDPLLDQLLGTCRTFALHPDPGETVDDVLREAAAHSPALIFLSPAIGNVKAVAGQLRGSRVCCLVDGESPFDPAGVGCEVLRAERITADMVDMWVRRPGGAAAQPVQQAAPPPLQSSGFPLPQGLIKPKEAPETPRERPARRPPGPAVGGPELPIPSVSVLRQQIVTLWGGKPGAGRSTIAVAVSHLLARLSTVRVCTVDLNPYNSSLAVLVGKEKEASSWFHLAAGLQRGAFPLAEALRWVQPNWAVLTGPDGNEEWIGLLDEGAICDLVDSLRSQFDYIILDAEARPGQISDTALRLAQTVLVVVSADIADVFDTTRSFQTAVDRGLVDRQRCRLVCNKWLETAHLRSEDLSASLGLAVGARIPLGAQAVLEAAGQGVPVTKLGTAEAQPVSQGMAAAAGLIAETLAATGNGGRSPLRSWFGRS
jgi:MinD-like ATPase involved in chromosome partitioning or flagellar assembly